MELKKVYIDAYKSIVNKELEISDSCIGIVGINESGKSNVLNAISMLSGDAQLSIQDSPKMNKKMNPYIRYEFALTSDEVDKIKEGLKNWDQSLVVDASNFISDSTTIIYHVTFDKNKQKEQRYFTLDNLVIPEDMYVLKTDAVTDGYKLWEGGHCISIDECLLVTNEYFEADEKCRKASEEFINIENKIGECKRKIKEIQQEIDGGEIEKNEVVANSDKTQEVDNEFTAKNISLSNEIEKLEEKLGALNNKSHEIEKSIEAFNVYDGMQTYKEDLELASERLKDLEESLGAAKTRQEKLNSTPNKTDAVVKEINDAKTSVSNLEKEIGKQKQEIRKYEAYMSSLGEGLRCKYEINNEQVSKDVGDGVSDIVDTMIPRVILWRHDKKYILGGETEFLEILNAESFDDISRPLVNLFRIGLKIKTLEELKETVRELQADASERSKYERQLNLKTNGYIKSVWPDYDQSINIKLEHDQIIVQFYDSACDADASYYVMEERSQGCQTFVSFLLTIGAEAKHGVISNTVLLLDEPETHLHPSGVRHMLNELIKASENGNKVLYATHSVFMIDKENYSRHVIVKKEKEQTSIIPSRKDRIGFFMQEEVLYSTLDIDLNKQFDSTNIYNFVFEGDGDAALFEKFYSKCLTGRDKVFPDKQTSFYHGGKCSDIKHYFSTKPIQLGSKWVFILDKDKPADDLVRMIKGKYKDFIDEYIYVFQYGKENIGSSSVELEDLLPGELMKDAFVEAAKNINDGEGGLGFLDGVDFDSDSYSSYSEVIYRKLDEIGIEVGGYKEILKRTINEKIKSRTDEVGSMKTMDSKFPMYSEWAKSVISRIRDGAK